MRLSCTISLLSLLILLPSCFTGVESTPRITYKEVERNGVSTGSTPEEKLAAELSSDGFAHWKPGKELIVASPKIRLVLNTVSGNDINLQPGDTLTYINAVANTDITGRDIMWLKFNSALSSAPLSYNSNCDSLELASRQRFELPFTIDLDTVEKARRKLIGEHLYILTPLWYDAEGNGINGTRFVPVTIIDVQPANEVYPFKVLFTIDDATAIPLPVRCIYLSEGDATRRMPHDFGSMFSFTNPRAKYPKITDENWQLIQNSRIAVGMTKDEVRLALGSPDSIDQGHNYSSVFERWSYTDGVYVLFEEGLVIRFRQ